MSPEDISWAVDDTLTWQRPRVAALDLVAAAARQGHPHGRGRGARRARRARRGRRLESRRPPARRGRRDARRAAGGRRGGWRPRRRADGRRDPARNRRRQGARARGAGRARRPAAAVGARGRAAQTASSASSSCSATRSSSPLRSAAAPLPPTSRARTSARAPPPDRVSRPTNRAAASRAIYEGGHHGNDQGNDRHQRADEHGVQPVVAVRAVPEVHGSCRVGSPRVDDTHLRWVANVGGARREWEAEIIEQVPGRKVAWRAAAGDGPNGIVTFEPPRDPTRRS